MESKRHVYFCEMGGKTVYVLERKTKPRMQQIISAYGSKWQVWYVEYEPNGVCSARLEPYSEMAA